jgi:Tol biopolymer transport system component
MPSYDQYAPSLSSDGRTLYFAASRTGGSDDIFVATRPDRGAAFSAATRVDEVNTASADGSPAISNDGLTLYFYSNRPGGPGGRDIWLATRTDATAAFGNARVLAVVNSDSDDNQQWISRDGLTLLFSSGRSGGTDLFMAKRANANEAFASPVSVDGVNGDTTREDRAALSNDGLTLYFTSDRKSGAGDRDIWYATRPDAESAFSNIANLQVVNSASRDADVSLSSDERELFFVSKRSGLYQLYRSIRTCQ